MSVLANRYARALFEVAAEKGAVEAVSVDLGKLAEALADRDVRAVLMDPQTKRSERKAVLGRIMGSAHELSTNLLDVVLTRRREAILPELHAAFEEMARAARGEVAGILESARPIEEEQVRAIETSMTGTVGSKVALEVQINPDLLGGVRVRVGNTLYDGSVATELEELERRLMEAPIP